MITFFNYRKKSTIWHGIMRMLRNDPSHDHSILSEGQDRTDSHASWMRGTDSCLCLNRNFPSAVLPASYRRHAFYNPLTP